MFRDETPEPAKPLIREWHDMSADEQHAEWAALVDWVIWIHDLYELSKEERLPLCWTRHPGLIEELRSLKAWRDTIYDSPQSAAVAHTARSWHGELRQTIAAATTFWAPTCRAGHTDAEPLNRAQPDAAQQWRSATAPTVTSSPRRAGHSGGNEISDADMAAAFAAGQARPHSRGMPYYAHLNGSWWTRASDAFTWLRCTDPVHHAHLDATSARLRAAEAAHDEINP
jgi:hypothetical protein